jgi:hypothetical protein
VKEFIPGLQCARQAGRRISSSFSRSTVFGHIYGTNMRNSGQIPSILTSNTAAISSPHLDQMCFIPTHRSIEQQTNEHIQYPIQMAKLARVIGDIVKTEFRLFNKHTSVSERAKLKGGKAVCQSGKASCRKK